MPWQPWRLSPSSSKVFGALRAPRLAQRAFVQRCSPSILASPSIASILATQPRGDAHTITAVGSVRTVRNQKQRSFVEIGDGSTIHSLQALLQPAQAEGLGTGTLVAIKGLWREAPKGKEQPFELEAEDVQIIGPADSESYPMQKKFHSAEYLRTIPHLRLRTPFNALLTRLKSECDFRVAEHLRLQGFVRVQPPIITSSDCEGAGEVFSVSTNAQVNCTDATSETHPNREHFFRDVKFLTVSSQLHLEAFMHEHPKVWTLSPTFRAEKSDTPRHVSEFWMLEAELRTEEVETIMFLVEQMIQNLVNGLKDLNFMQELVDVAPKTDLGDIDHRQRAEQLQERWDGLVRLPYPRITYSDAMHLLQKASESQEASFQYKPLWEQGLQLEHEKYIAAYVGQGSPVFVTNYPSEVKPFYMLHSSTKDGEPVSAACFDLLLPDGTEVVGGSIREHRLENLDRAMRARGLRAPSPTSHSAVDPSSQGQRAVRGGDLEWYLDLRRYGSVPHGGFGLGFDRLIGYLAGVSNIRDVVAWPRYYGRCHG